MKIDGIDITLEEVSATANSISAKNTQLSDILNEISLRMAALSSSWQSDAGEVIRGKMEGMKVVFESYRETIESYVNFLNDTVAQYTATESQIKGNASAFH